MARSEKLVVVVALGLAIIVTGCASGEGLVFRSPSRDDIEATDPFADKDEKVDPDTQTAGIDPQVFKEALKISEEIKKTDPELHKEFVAQLENTDAALVGRLVHTWKAVLAYKQKQGEEDPQFASADEPIEQEEARAAADEPFTSSLADLTPGQRNDRDDFWADPEDLQSRDSESLDFDKAPVTALRPFDAAVARPEQPVHFEVANQKETTQGANRALGLSEQSADTSPGDLVSSEPDSSGIKSWNDPPKPTVPTSTATNDLNRVLGEAEQGKGPLSELPEGVQGEVYKRFLLLMAGQRDKALEPIASLTAEEQEFWTNLLWATSNQLDRDSIPNDSDRAAQTVEQLNEAVARLRSRANLEVKNLAFCQRIQSFGSYDRFPRYEFAASEPVLLYAEVENYHSEASAQGFRTVLRSTIEILDMQGHQVWKQQFAPTEDRCENYRRDYFHSYNFSMPQRIYAGPYLLKLTIEDQLGGKVAEGSIEFQVVDK